MTIVAQRGAERQIEPLDALKSRRLPLDLIDYALFLPSIMLPCALGISLRLIGPLFLIMPVCSCVLYALLRRTSPPRLLALYYFFCLFYAALSSYQVLPSAWQVHFMEGAILRQLVPLTGFVAVAWASKAYFLRRLVDGDVFYGASVFLVLGLLVAPAVMFAQGLGYEGQDSLHAIPALYGALINNVVIADFFVMGAIFLTRDWRRYLAFAYVLLIAATSHFAQFKLVAMALIAIALGASGRKVVIAVAIVLPIIYAVGLYRIPEVMRSNPNSGIRLAFVSDALTSTIETRGIGVGYGKESVRWRYDFPQIPTFTFLPDPRSMTRERMLEALSTGVENSFAESLLRTGLVGFLLFVVSYFNAIPRGDLRRDVQSHASLVFSMSFIGMFVNSALESPLSTVGHAYVYGYLLSLRALSPQRGIAPAGGGRAAIFGEGARRAIGAVIPEFGISIALKSRRP